MSVTRKIWVLGTVLVALFLGTPATTEGTVLFEDNFDDGDLTGWTEVGGDWSVVDGHAHTVGGGFPWDPPGNVLVINGSSLWRDYVVECDFLVTGIGGGQDREILVRYTGPGSYYWVNLLSDWSDPAPGTDKTRLFHPEDGCLAESLAVPHDVGAWDHLKVELIGSTLSVYVNDTWAFDYTDPLSEFSSGGVALAAHRGSNGSPDVYFDNVTVTLIPEPSSIILLTVAAVGLLGYTLRRRR